MRSADVTVNLDKVDTNILMVNLNGSRIKPVQLYDMLLKVSTDVAFDARTTRLYKAYFEHLSANRVGDIAKTRLPWAKTRGATRTHTQQSSTGPVWVFAGRWREREHRVQGECDGRQNIVFIRRMRADGFAQGHFGGGRGHGYWKDQIRNRQYQFL